MNNIASLKTILDSIQESPHVILHVVRDASSDTWQVTRRDVLRPCPMGESPSIVTSHPSTRQSSVPTDTTDSNTSSFITATTTTTTTTDTETTATQTLFSQPTESCSDTTDEFDDDAAIEPPLPPISEDADDVRTDVSQTGEESDSEEDDFEPGSSGEVVPSVRAVEVLHCWRDGRVSHLSDSKESSNPVLSSEGFNELLRDVHNYLEIDIKPTEYQQQKQDLYPTPTPVSPTLKGELPLPYYGTNTADRTAPSFPPRATGGSTFGALDAEIIADILSRVYELLDMLEFLCASPSPPPIEEDLNNQFEEIMSLAAILPETKKEHIETRLLRLASTHSIIFNVSKSLEEQQQNNNNQVVVEEEEEDSVSIDEEDIEFVASEDFLYLDDLL